MICFFVASVFAAEEEVISIPLTRQSVYMPKGLSVGIGAGIFNPTKDCDCLGVWQGQLEYFYSNHVSGSFDVFFFGGDLDTEAMILYQRYRVNARFHFPKGSLNFFISPVLGFETTDIEAFREEWDNRERDWWRPDLDMDSVKIVKDCEKMFSLDGFSVGIESGVGWLFSKYFGLTEGVLYEYNLSGAHLLTLTPGFAFNLRELFEWPHRVLSSMWLSFEVGFQRFFNRGVDEWASSGFLGLQVGI